MENWGLVTYRENSLLYDSAYSSISNKERVVTVIAHELAHQVAAVPLAHPAGHWTWLTGCCVLPSQWFGNLVTLRWWNDLWLNEGFASYVEYLGADSAEPSWHIVSAHGHRVGGRGCRQGVRAPVARRVHAGLEWHSTVPQKDLMVLNEVYTVMGTDALTTSHPLSIPEDEVRTPAQISEVFDSIAYSKVGTRGAPWAVGRAAGCPACLGSL